MIKDRTDQIWLPDLCNALALLRLLLLAILVALTLTILRSGIGGISLADAGVLFLYSTWVVFVSAAGLCGLRRFMSNLSVPLSVTCSVVWLLIAGSICALFASWIAQVFMFEEEISGSRLWLDTAIINLIIGALVLRFLFVHHQLQMQQQRLMQAQFDALQARIRPHFLFNSLNSIASLAGIDSQRTEEAILNLSDILRATLGEKEVVSLAEELETCRKYLEIEKLRMGDRLQVAWDVDEKCKSIQMPPLCLQPLMENAVLHALQKIPQGGELFVRVQEFGDAVVIEVSNPLPALDDSAETSGTKSALNNIRARLEKFYAERLDFQAGEVNGTYMVKILIRASNG